MRSGLSQIGTLCLNNSEAALHFDLRLLALPPPHPWVLYTFFKTYFDIDTVSKTLYLLHASFWRSCNHGITSSIGFVALVMDWTEIRSSKELWVYYCVKAIPWSWGLWRLRWWASRLAWEWRSKLWRHHEGRRWGGKLGGEEGMRWGRGEPRPHIKEL